ncbi:MULTISPECIES: RNA polymerase sigma factor [Pseudomonas]|jgi:RNA polymerase sigma-70 factor (ECF subfamily)|uniref:RNA polymerase sigma factor n=1 Tax=Pseudomonas TaxID=286 RepID=UPI001AE27837|nr:MULTISPECIES: RNA polymerase sigma factor [unclassified Pseudomonas]WQG59365.1 RNA polymerase sigma factor [Pseudomonas sp. RTB3]MBP1127155.1 RNA polymerase sigma-70 factor (ECF subfamily) [Pseudomonas sp. PvP025]MDQ0401015.1 RNA polymerase sigma-70 factor (ECF subfamily) [Pseudomonas sp. PvP006]MEB0106013.1 RNA polymerase sigma factor [Pseudomonas sp. MH9.3]WPX77986.1 RNA polymerase sigma factor [Pseudomonas sp. MH9.3]
MPTPAASPSDESLLVRYRTGDAAAFEALYARHRQGLYRFLVALCNKAELAEEIYQETWLSLIRSTTQPQGRASFRTWLFQIARNRLIDHWRKHGIHSPLHDSYDEQLHAQPDHDAGPEQQLSLSRDQARLDAALQGLPDDQREVFLLRLHGDLDVPQIAALTNAPLETVKSRLRYAQQKLRRLLAEEITA